MRTRRAAPHQNVRGYRRPSLVKHQTSICEVLNRTLDTGAVVMGELIISIAGVDLLYLNLNVVLSSVETLLDAMDSPTGPIMGAPAELPEGSREMVALCETNE